MSATATPVIMEGTANLGTIAIATLVRTAGSAPTRRSLVFIVCVRKVILGSSARHLIRAQKPPV